MSADLGCAMTGIRSRVSPRRELERAKKTLLRLFASAPDAFWRHDVDLSLRAAVDMARLHQLAGTRATFYLDPRSEHYNLFSRPGGHAIDELLAAGQAIGLHCHVRKGEDVVERVIDDQRLLFDAVPADSTRRVSFHIPTPNLLWVDFEPYFDSAYASRWRDRYLSDSRGHLIEALAIDETAEWQINLHPEWWL